MGQAHSSTRHITYPAPPLEDAVIHYDAKEVVRGAQQSEPPHPARSNDHLTTVSLHLEKLHLYVGSSVANGEDCGHDAANVSLDR